MKSLLAVFAALMLSGCLRNNSPTPPLINLGACDNEFHQTLIGTYEGVLKHSTDVRQCDWDVSVVIFNPSSPGLTCDLEAEFKSTVEQYTVPTGDGAYQCMAFNAVRTVFEDPWFFPAEVEFHFLPNVERTGPYFGNENIEARYIYLLDGLSNLVETMQIEATGEFVFKGRELTGTLLKVNQ